MVHFY